MSMKWQSHEHLKDGIILEWIAQRLASFYSIQRSNVGNGLEMKIETYFYSYEITSSKTFSKSINSYNFQYSIRILRYTHAYTCQHSSVWFCKLRRIYEQFIPRSILSLRCSRNSHFIDIPYPKILRIQLIHVFRQK